MADLQTVRTLWCNYCQSCHDDPACENGTQSWDRRAALDQLLDAAVCPCDECQARPPKLTVPTRERKCGFDHIYPSTRPGTLCYCERKTWVGDRRATE